MLASPVPGRLLIDTTFDVPGADGTYVYSIDGSNIVGYYDGSGRRHGFRFDGQYYTTLDVRGAGRTTVLGIDGSNIVGFYYDTDYNAHGFIAAIPEPATLSLLMLGGLMLLRRQRCGRVTDNSGVGVSRYCVDSNIDVGRCWRDQDRVVAKAFQAELQRT